MGAQTHSISPLMSFLQPQLSPFTQSILRDATPGPLPPTASKDSQATPPSPSGAFQEQIHVDLISGYLVSVIQHSTQTAAPPARGRAPAPKKTQIVKSDCMRIETMSRYELAEACLSVHNLEDDYRPHKVSGFPFKMWWTGYSGGKAAAATIETDTEYELLIAQLRASKKNAKDITVFVSFDIDEMDNFRRLRKQPAPSDSMDHATGLGTKVPRLADMDAPTQLHGNIITMLKATHPCEKHRGEHGEAGFCYVTPNGTHIGLNNCRFAIWSAAVAAGDATCHTPPNVAEFDGHQGLGPATTKPCGRGSASTIASPATPTTLLDPTAMFMAAMVPLLVSLTQTIAPHPTPQVEEKVAKVAVVLADDLTDTDEPGVATGFTFLPSHTFNCVLTFKLDTGINLVDKVAALDHCNLTPDIIPEVPHEHLAGVLGVSEGKTIQFQLYCRQWAKDFSHKRKEKETA
ncbi:hypothetical protein RHS03_06503, partial [Rhizoctonia solani]